MVIKKKQFLHPLRMGGMGVRGHVGLIRFYRSRRTGKAQASTPWCALATSGGGVDMRAY